MPLTWTRTPPTVPGWYWCRRPESAPSITLAEMRGSHLLTRDLLYFDEYPEGTVFAGPIPEPEECTP